MENKTTVCICIPVDDGARQEFWVSLITLMNCAPLLFQDVTLELKTNNGDSLITRARNNLTHEFLTKSEADYLLFLDTDLEFTPQDIKRLIDQRKEDAVVCGQYAIKQAELRMVYIPLKGEQVGPDDLLKVAQAGTGCMLIPRKILEAFKEKFPSLEYTDDNAKDKRFSFFDVGVVKETETWSRYYSEDYLFCRRVRQLGFPVYLDIGILLKHLGWIAYPLSDDYLIDALVSRAPTRELLQSYLDDIDKAASARWKEHYATELIKP